MKYFIITLIKEALSIPEFLLSMTAIGIVVSIVFVLVSAGANKSKKVAKNIKVKIEQKKQENELKSSIESNMREYQEFKNSFQFFSDERILNIYEQFLNGTKRSNMEQLALEEELVKRGLIDHSPTHEKLYAINKEFLNKKIDD
jgi:DNA/RNA-binding domain of Phe-tRNA-synthetase-like protein